MSQNEPTNSPAPGAKGAGGDERRTDSRAHGDQQDQRTKRGAGASSHERAFRGVPEGDEVNEELGIVHPTEDAPGVRAAVRGGRSAR